MPRQTIHTDGSFSDATGAGGWAAVVLNTRTGRQTGGDSYAMELRAVVEAVKMADGPCTVVTDSQVIPRQIATGAVPRKCPELWRELYAAFRGKDVRVEWHRRAGTHGQRLAHELARAAARGLSE